MSKVWQFLLLSCIIRNGRIERPPLLCQSLRLLVKWEVKTKKGRFIPPKKRGKEGAAMEQINTKRLILRPFEESDWKDVYQYLSDEEVVFYEPYEVFTVKEAKACVLERAKDPSFYAVCLKEENKVIGNLYFHKEEFETYELGYVFNKAYWSKGYAYESVHALLAYAFDEKNVRRVTALCNPLNTRSWRLLERLGMRREGTLLQNIWFKTDEKGNPIWCDTYEYGLLQSEWDGDFKRKG